MLSGYDSEYAQCPFDKNHKMLSSNLQRHIIYCMVKHPNFLKCPVNALHRFATKEELDRHVPECPSRRNVPLEDEPQGNTGMVGDNYYESKQFHMSEENWNKLYERR